MGIQKFRIVSDNPMVSIITPVYNGEKYLAETIDAILDQSYKNWELLLLDDGSSDSSAQIIKGYTDDRIKYTLLDHQGNPAKVRNIGIKKAEGPLIALCDQDDLWCPGKLEAQVACLDQDDIGMVSGYTDRIDSSGNPIPDKDSVVKKLIREHVGKIRKECIEGASEESYTILPNYILIVENYIMNSSVLVRKEVYEKVGYLSEENALRGVEDYEFLLRLICGGYSIAYIPQNIAMWRVHTSNLSHEWGNASGIKAILRAITKALQCKEFQVMPQAAGFQRTMQLKYKLSRAESRDSWLKKFSYFWRMGQFVLMKRLFRLFHRSYY